MLPGHAASARRPPLILERCLRTQLIWEMSAPDSSSCRFICCFSVRLSSSIGSVSKEDPPPESRHSSRSPSSSDAAISRIRFAVCRPAVSGIGWAASRTSISLQVFACPYGVSTTPDRGPGLQASKACAMDAAAFPAPTTTVRAADPFGIRLRSISLLGSALATAAQNRACINWRGSFWTETFTWCICS